MDTQAEVLDTFAVRGDGALVCFDEEGYFLLVWTGPGMVGGEAVPNLIQAVDPKTNEKARIYCEPAWIVGYYDTVRGS